LKLHS